MSGTQQDLIRYRLTRADETLGEARLLAGASRWNACVNRLYYACFYAVSGLLIQQNLSSSKHVGVRSLFNRHYVKTGKISKDQADLYNQLFDSRQEGDYKDFFLFTEAEVSPLIARVESFLADINMLAQQEQISDKR